MGRAEDYLPPEPQEPRRPKSPDRYVLDERIANDPVLWAVYNLGVTDRGVLENPGNELAAEQQNKAEDEAGRATRLADLRGLASVTGYAPTPPDRCIVTPHRSAAEAIRQTVQTVRDERAARGGEPRHTDARNLRRVL